MVRLVVITLVATYALIVIGSSVRASGAGLGCPDWPTCFDRLIPPTSVSQLPTNYQQIYADRGYANTEFNPIKTWTEFGNRLSSTVVGLLMLACFVMACLTQRANRPLLLTLTAMLGITAFQVWMGSIVVASYLHPLVVSSHMIFALIIIGCLHTALQLTRPALMLDVQIRKHIPWLVACAGVLILQVGLGLQLRQEIDVLIRIESQPRKSWGHLLGSSFTAHVLFSLVALHLFAITQFRLWRDPVLRPLLRNWIILWWFALGGSIIVGLGLWVFAITPLLQPLHLLAAAIQSGVVWHLLFFVMRSNAHTPQPG